MARTETERENGCFLDETQKRGTATEGERKGKRFHEMSFPRQNGRHRKRGAQRKWWIIPLLLNGTCDTGKFVFNTVLSYICHNRLSTWVEMNNWDCEPHALVFWTGTEFSQKVGKARFSRLLVAPLPIFRQRKFHSVARICTSDLSLVDF